VWIKSCLEFFEAIYNIFVLLVNMFWGLVPPHELNHDPPTKKRNSVVSLV
jgi:hypothetical protein